MKLAIAYRIYPGISKTPFLYPEPFGDKLSLSRAALKSFRGAIGEIDFKIFALLDGCSTEYESLFREVFDADRLEVLHLPKLGNEATFGRQIDLLLNQDFSENVYFAEDDYAYLPGAMEEAIRFLESTHAEFVTVYDHPDYYSHPLHAGDYETRSFCGRGWRTGASTCLTFLTTRETLRATEGVFRTYCRGNSDSGVWIAVTKHRVFDLPHIVRFALTNRSAFRSYRRTWRYGWSQNLFGKKFRLWFPSASLGTHLESGFLARGVDWAEVLVSSAQTLQRAASPPTAFDELPASSGVTGTRSSNEEGC